MTRIINTAKITARTAHRCMLCYVIAVAPGDTYERTTLVCDGRVYNWVQCTDCVAVARLAQASDYSVGDDDGVDGDSCMEWAQDALLAVDADARTVAVAYLRRVRDSGYVTGLSDTLLALIDHHYDTPRRVPCLTNS